MSQGVEILSPNLLTLTSVDEYGNPAGSSQTVDVPVDTLGPRVDISNGGDTTGDATFTITVADENITSFNYVPTISSGTMSPLACTINPCVVTVSGADGGSLTLTIPSGLIADDLGLSGPVSDEASSVSVFDTLIDFSRISSPPLQTGYTGCVPPTCSIPSTYSTASNLSLSITTPFSRDYAAIIGGPFVGLSNLLSDSILANGPGQVIRVQINNLQAGSYKIRAWHHDTAFGPRPGTLTSTDSNGPSVVFSNEPQEPASTSPPNVKTSSFSIVIANDNDPFIIEYEQVGVSPGHININGIDLTEE